MFNSLPSVLLLVQPVKVPLDNVSGQQLAKQNVANLFIFTYLKWSNKACTFDSTAVAGGPFKYALTNSEKSRICATHSHIFILLIPTSLNKVSVGISKQLLVDLLHLIAA